jgi:hypothetical protein
MRSTYAKSKSDVVVSKNELEYVLHQKRHDDRQDKQRDSLSATSRKWAQHKPINPERKRSAQRNSRKYLQRYAACVLLRDEGTVRSHGENFAMGKVWYVGNGVLE